MRLNLEFEVNGKKATVIGEIELSKGELIAFGMNPVATVRALILGESNGILQTETEFAEEKQKIADISASIRRDQDEFRNQKDDETFNHDEFEKARQCMEENFREMSARVDALFKK